MAAMAGLINQAGQSLIAGNSSTVGQAAPGRDANPLTAQTTGTSSTGSPGSSSATISANDFLTLLVTEMQNQDPTADTDPNEYINQLVNVNSLEQLIDINQNLTTALGGSGSSSSGSSSGQTGAAKSSLTGASPAGTTAAGPAAVHTPGEVNGVRAANAGQAGSAAPGSKPGSNVAAAINQFAQSVRTKGAPGNLSIPPAQPAARHVAHALDGHSRAPSIPGKLPAAQ